MKVKQRQLKLKNTTYPYSIRKSKRAKNILLHVDADAKVELVVPWRVAYWQADMFAKRKRSWLSQRIAWAINERLKIKPIKLDHPEVWYRKRAKEVLSVQAAELANVLGVKVNRIRIGKFKTQWGSASKDGRISLDWRLLLVPPGVARYVLAHEVCHLKHLNHSKKFWDLVGSVVPDYKEHKKWLKKNGQKLHSVL